MSERVFYFTDSPAFGGAERVMLTLMQGLDRTRWNPLLVHYPGRGLEAFVARVRDSGIETWAVPPMHGLQGAQRLPNFVRALCARRPAVFHAHLTMPLACKFALTGAALARVPAVIATEHLFVDIPYRHSRWLERLAAPGIGKFIAVSHHIARELSKTFSFMSRKMSVVHNGIAVQALQHANAAAAFHSANPVVVTIARLTPQKGLTFLLEAAAHIPDATFVIAGEGAQRGALQAHARRLCIQDRVHFLGHCDDIPALLANSDIFALPSLFEGLPLSILEAMAAGVPVIATDVGGAGEAVEHGKTGLLVPPTDAAALTYALRRLLDDAVLACRLANAAQGRVRREFSAETMVRRTTEIYEQVLQK